MLTEEKLQEIQQKHPRGALFTKGDIQLYCRKPSRGERIAFLSSLMVDDKKSAERRALAIEKLVRSITVFPEPRELDELYEEYGFALDRMGGDIMDWLSGGDDAVEVKKY